MLNYAKRKEKYFSQLHCSWHFHHNKSVASRGKYENKSARESAFDFIPLKISFVQQLWSPLRISYYCDVVHLFLVEEFYRWNMGTNLLFLFSVILFYLASITRHFNDIFHEYFRHRRWLLLIYQFVFYQLTATLYLAENC